MQNAALSLNPPIAPLAAARTTMPLFSGIVIQEVNEKGKSYMKIAVACDGLNVSSHAARCDSFMCYKVDKGIITECRNLPNMDVTSHAAAQLIIGLEFDALITGGIDMDMANELCSANIEVVAGVKGTAREALNAYVSNTLMGDAVALCHIHEYDDAEDEDIEAAFAKIAEMLESAS